MYIWQVLLSALLCENRSHQESQQQAPQGIAKARAANATYRTLQVQLMHLVMSIHVW